MSVELLEEIEVLQSIYADLIDTVQETDHWGISYRHPDNVFRVNFRIALSYPVGDDSLSFDIAPFEKDLFSEGVISVKEIIANRNGECILFQTIEVLRDSYEVNKTLLQQSFAEDEENLEVSHQTSQEEEEEDLEPDKSAHRDPRVVFDFALPPGSSGLNIISGPITTQQKSNFQTHLAEVHSMEEVYAFRSEVLSDRKIACATHNIFAYRFTSAETRICHHDCDDDGETAAGSRLAEMMRLMGVANVAVIVTRWFGGIKLGPDRFKLICNSARDLLEENGFGLEAQKQAAKAVKAAQLKQREKEREKDEHGKDSHSSRSKRR